MADTLEIIEKATFGDPRNRGKHGLALTELRHAMRSNGETNDQDMRSLDNNHEHSSMLEVHQSKTSLTKYETKLFVSSG
jgi:hypothetical protein